ncbi:MAG: hypothetical protein QM817_06470 [Archangium sp.]
MIGLIALWAVSFLCVSLAHWSSTNAAIAKYRRAVELGEKQAPLPSPSMPLLAEACAGKLEKGSPASILAYVAKMQTLPPLEESYWHVDRTLLGVSHVLFLSLTDRFFPEPSVIDDATFGRSLSDNADPTDWVRHLKWAAEGSPQIDEVRYLIVARYGPLTMPELTDTGFIAGTGEFGARVLKFPSGELVCEGRSRVRMKNSVSASGRGQSDADANARRLVPFVFTESVTRTPLAEVCEAGGAELCKLTGEWVSPERTPHGG